jgi:type I restriction enzyme S subunit
MPFGLSNETVDQIRSVFARHPEVRQAILYGSRAMGTHRDASDIDLALTGQDLNLAILARIETELDDLLLPWQFDLSIRSQIKTESLLNHMERVGVLFYERENKTEGNPPGGAGKEGWEVKRLGEVCSFLKRGISPKYVEQGGIVVLNQRCIREHRVNFQFARRHDIKAKIVSAERYLQAGDVLVNSTGEGTLGRIAQLRDATAEPTTVDSHVTIVRPSPGRFFTEFFGYVLMDIEEELKMSGEGCGGQTELNSSVLSEKFVVRFPKSLAEQKRIVAILDEAFAGIATAKANAEKNLQNALALFESHLNAVFSQRGEGWVETKLGDVCQFVGGSQPPKSVFSKTKSTDNIRLIQIRDYKSDKHLVYIPRAKARRFCSADDVMIGRYGPPLFQILRGLDGAYNVALMKAVPDESKLSRDFLFYFLKHSTILEYVIYHSNRAAGQIGVTKETLEPYPIALPSLSEQKKVVAKLETLSAETQRLAGVYERKLAALEALKKSLLQRAFAGEL